MLVKELKEYNNLPDKFLNLLPVECHGLIDDNGKTLVECNHYIGINETLTRMYCTNPRCPATVAKNVFAICINFDLDFIDLEVVNSFVSEWGITNPLQIFMYESTDGKFSSLLSDYQCKQLYEEINKRRNMKLEDYFEYFGITSFNNKLMKIMLSNVDSFNELYEGIDKDGFKFIHSIFNRKIELSYTEKEYAHEIYDSIMSGDLTRVGEFSKRVYETDNVNIIKEILSKGVDYLLDKLREAENPEFNSIFLLEIEIFRDLILYRKDLTDCISFVKIYK